MERNRPVTIASAIVILLICGAGVVASITCAPDHPVKTSLITLAVVFAGLAAITGIHFLMFVPLFTIITRLFGKNRKSEDAEQIPAGDRLKAPPEE